MAQQWQSARSQAYRRRAYVLVEVNGQNVTDRLDPYLISVQIVSKFADIDTCAIELDDRDAKLAIPPDEAPIVVSLGWAGEGPRIPLFRHFEAIYDVLPNDPQILATLNGELPWEGSGLRVVFQGFVISCESGFSRRGGGRRLWIEAQSGNTKGDIKTPDIMAWGKGITNEGSPDAEGDGVSLSDVMSEAGKKAGIDVEVGPEFKDLKRNFWHQNESFQHFGARIAAEIGADFKIVGNKATILKSGFNSLGENMPTIEAFWGINLISWRIKPFVARPQWAATRNRWFDLAGGKWSEIMGDIGGSTPFGGAKAAAGIPSSAPNRQVGEQFNGGVEQTSIHRRGTGWCIINGEPSAIASASVVIVGARPGVDGRYFIMEAEHNYTRGGGYTTRLNIDQPQFNPEVFEKMGWPKLPAPTKPPPSEFPPEPPPPFRLEDEPDTFDERFNVPTGS